MVNFDECKDKNLARQLFFITSINGQDSKHNSNNDWYGLILDYNNKHYIVHQDDDGLFTYSEFTNRAQAEDAWSEIATALDKHNTETDKWGG